MGAISELIRTEKDGTISFGDYTLDKKEKLDNFEHDGDLYKVKPERRVRCSQPGSCQSGKMLKETSEDPRIRVFFAL